MYLPLLLLFVTAATACSPSLSPPAAETEPASTIEAASTVPAIETVPIPVETDPPASELEPTLTETIPVSGPQMVPPDDIPPLTERIYDVESAGNAAPYGDSYRINRLERPFGQDMTYLPDLDILRFELGKDNDWIYVSIRLNGNNPNNDLGIHYGVELDANADGLGDLIIWASPPYGTDWTRTNVQVFEDSNKDTGGLSSSQSDPGFEGDGYDTLVDDDPDLAWVRMQDGAEAQVQFAFKRSWSGDSFVLGVVADAGIKDVSQFDYNDRFELSQAGSPVRNDPNYPLGPLYAVDNTCWQPYEIQSIVPHRKFCPPLVQPAATRRPGSDDDPVIPPPGPACDAEKCGGGPYDPITCECIVSDE